MPPIALCSGPPFVSRTGVYVCCGSFSEVILRIHAHSLRDNILHNVSVDVGQSVIASLMAVCQLFVVDSKQVHAGGVEVMHVHGILGNSETKLVLSRRLLFSSLAFCFEKSFRVGGTLRFRGSVIRLTRFVGRYTCCTAYIEG